MLKNCAFVVAVALACASSLSAKVSCTNTWTLGTYVVLTTSSPVTLTFIDPGQGDNTDICNTDPDSCTTLPCYMTGCIDLPYNTRNCLMYLVSQCGTQAPLIRQVTFLSAGACP